MSNNELTIIDIDFVMFHHRHRIVVMNRNVMYDIPYIIAPCDRLAEVRFQLFHLFWGPQPNCRIDLYRIIYRDAIKPLAGYGNLSGYCHYLVNAETCKCVYSITAL